MSMQNRRHRMRARWLGWLMVASMIGLALFPFSGTALGHTPSATLTCEDGLVVSLTLYEVAPNDSTPNRVDVSIDGVPVPGSPFSFGATFQQTWTQQTSPDLLSPTEPHTATVKVTAFDDPNWPAWNPTYHLSIDACAEPTPTPTVAPTPTPTVEPTPTPTVEPTPTPTVAPTPTPTVEPTPTPTVEPTPTPTVEPTPTPTVAPTPTPTVEPTPTPTVAPTPTPTVEPTPTATPSGSVEAVTGTPEITPPPTDSLTSASGSPNNSWRLLLLGMAGILAGILLLMPAEPERTRRR